jgi:hypothetical protein
MHQREPPHTLAPLVARSTHTWLALVTGSARSWVNPPLCPSFRCPCTLVLGACSGDRICSLVDRNATRPWSPTLVTGSTLLWLDPCTRSRRCSDALVEVRSTPPPLLRTRSMPPPPPVSGWWQDPPPVAGWRLHGFTIS